MIDAGVTLRRHGDATILDDFKRMMDGTPCAAQA
jgi:hypothetical protein